MVKTIEPTVLDEKIKVDEFNRNIDILIRDEIYYNNLIIVNNDGIRMDIIIHHITEPLINGNKGIYLRLECGAYHINKKSHSIYKYKLREDGININDLNRCNMELIYHINDSKARLY